MNSIAASRASKEEHLALLLEKRRRLARTSLLPFVEATMPTYRAGWHHRLLCQKLDLFAAGRITRLMVFMPPRHGKSQLVSRHLPAYLLGRNPDAHLIACSYSSDLASRMNRDVQRVMDHPEYGRIFSGTCLWGRDSRGAGGKYLRNSDLFEVVGRQGCYRSAGVGGGITGMGFDYGIIDDPIKNREEADSPTVRESVWEWYTSTFYSRRAAGAGILLTMTRWNEDDLAGRLLRLAADDPSADRWEVLRLPALAEQDGDGLGSPRRVGDALWPERFPPSELERTRANSAYEWAALYQQDPRPEGGTEWGVNLFGPDVWFTDWPPGIQTRTIGLDPSKGKDAKHGDYSAFVLLGRSHDGMLWCEADLARGRPAEQIVSQGVEHVRTFRADALAVEADLFQELFVVLFRQASRVCGFPLPVMPLLTGGVPKQVRIRRLGQYLAAKQIRFRATPGTRELVRQLQLFPIGQFDDGPDALEIALRAMVELCHGRQQRNGRAQGAMR